MRGLTHNERILLTAPHGSERELFEEHRGSTLLQLARDGRIVIHDRTDDRYGNPIQFHYTVTEIGRMAVQLDAIDNPIRT